MGSDDSPVAVLCRDGARKLLGCKGTNRPVHNAVARSSSPTKTVYVLGPVLAMRRPGASTGREPPTSKVKKSKNIPAHIPVGPDPQRAAHRVAQMLVLRTAET